MSKKVVSVFSNVGVGEAYLADAGFHVAVACELNKDRCKVYQHVYPDATVIEGDVTLEATKRRFVEAAGQDVFLLIATPPCQGFSTLNPPRKLDGRPEGETDPRNQLVYETFKLMNDLKPPYALIENVPQMVKAFQNKDVERAVSEWLPDYTFKMAVLDAADFDTPQTRKRAIILFTRNGSPEWDFRPEWVRSKSSPSGSRRTTLDDAIGTLPPLGEAEYSDLHPWHFAQKHNADHVTWMTHTPTGKSAYDNECEDHQPRTVDKHSKKRRLIKGFGNTYKRMKWDEPAPTLIMGAHMISSSNTVHPGRLIKSSNPPRYDNARTLSVLEAMIVMGLPVQIGGDTTVPWNFPMPKNNPKFQCNKDELSLSYKQAINYLGEGLCPKVVKALVDNIPPVEEKR
jgi:DNA (cytosine-5)-methyltransferase 1